MPVEDPSANRKHPGVATYNGYFVTRHSIVRPSSHLDPIKQRRRNVALRERRNDRDDVLPLHSRSTGHLICRVQGRARRDTRRNAFELREIGRPIERGLVRYGDHLVDHVGVEDLRNEAGTDLAKLEGIPAGISSGAALYAAFQVAARPEMEGKNIVTIIPSFAERYITTPLFDGI